MRKLQYLVLDCSRLLLVGLIVITASFNNQTHAQNRLASAELKRAGNLNYEYDPGLFLPLRNGKIIAFDGMHYKNEPERLIKAADGITYGYGSGMIELFDPASGQSKVQTKMPFVFERGVGAGANRRQMQAVELSDGRIFLVGKFYGNSGMESSPLWRLGQSVSLPILSRSEPRYKLKVMGPNFRQRMFGLIYDPRQQSFECVDYPDTIPPRWIVAMNLLPDGRVLITGGCVTQNSLSWNEFPEKRVLCFDPGSKRLKVVGELKHARFGHAVVAMGKSQFLLIGGFGLSESEAKEQFALDKSKKSIVPIPIADSSFTHEVELFDLNTRRSRIVGKTLNGRYDFSVMLLPDQTVLINGGAASSLLGSNASELLNIKSGVTSYVGESFKPHPYQTDQTPYRFVGEGIDFRGIRAEDNRLIFAGRDTVYIYDWKKIKDRSWLQSHHESIRLLMPRIHHHLVENSDKRIFVLGGLTYTRVTGSSITNSRRASLIEEIVFPKSYRSSK